MSEEAGYMSGMHVRDVLLVILRRPHLWVLAQAADEGKFSHVMRALGRRRERLDIKNV